MSIIKIYKMTCGDCDQYIEECACCKTCGLVEGHLDGICPEEKTELQTVPPKHSYINTLVGLGPRKKCDEG